VNQKKEKLLKENFFSSGSRGKSGSTLTIDVDSSSPTSPSSSSSSHSASSASSASSVSSASSASSASSTSSSSPSSVSVLPASPDVEDLDPALRPQLNDFYAYVRRATEAPTKPESKFEKSHCAFTGCENDRVVGAYCETHRPSNSIAFSPVQTETADPLEEIEGKRNESNLLGKSQKSTELRSSSGANKKDKDTSKPSSAKGSGDEPSSQPTKPPHNRTPSGVFAPPMPKRPAPPPPSRPAPNPNQIVHTGSKSSPEDPPPPPPELPPPEEDEEDEGEDGEQEEELSEDEM